MATTTKSELTPRERETLLDLLATYTHGVTGYTWYKKPILRQIYFTRQATVAVHSTDPRGFRHGLVLDRRFPTGETGLLEALLWLQDPYTKEM